MKEGRSISELAAELERQDEAKGDYVVPTASLDFDVVGSDDDKKKIALGVPGHNFFNVTDNTHRQIAARIEVPYKYYARMLKNAPELLKTNVDHWFKATNERRMIRTLDGAARAFLSDRYNRIDHIDVATSALGAMSAYKAGGGKIVPLSNQVTDSKLHMKFLFPDLKADITPGDSVSPGVYISNSETGGGTFDVLGFFFRGYCTNGCVWGKIGEYGVSVRHVGAKVLTGSGFSVLTDETRAARNRALLLEAKDVVTAAATREHFESMVDGLRKAADPSTTVADPIGAVEVLGKSLALSNDEMLHVLRNFLEDKDYTRWGAANAVTKVANGVESYDRATELEEAGGKVLSMSARMWTEVMTAEPVKLAA